MRRKPVSVRDPSQLSGKPLSQTIVPSPISSDPARGGWVTSPDLIQADLPFTSDVMYNMTNFLLGNPNMNSPHLFRADILFDSTGELKTPEEKEKLFASKCSLDDEPHSDIEQAEKEEEKKLPVETIAPLEIPSVELRRTVVRKLVPRNLNIDKPIDQTCHIYDNQTTVSLDTENKTVERLIYVYFPHIKAVHDVPFYHPLVRGLAFIYDYEKTSPPGELSPTTGDEKPQCLGKGTLSLHILPFSSSENFDPFPIRLERTLQSLLNTSIRLARNTRPSSTSSTNQHTAEQGKQQADESYNPSKDNIIPRHRIQDTYSRLKLAYAQDLCQSWVEETEPSKHVFEDLSIAAFLIELWRGMYGVIPRAEKENPEKEDVEFPGFVDVACGNGVLVYILLMEGYKGWGFDARRRKSWSIFPDWIQDNLKESLYIPGPFVDEASQIDDSPITELVNMGIEYHTGNFPKNTFIISNHADELTVWTPLMAVLACPEFPLPFISIPCCSHSLSGARYRYPPPKQSKKNKNQEKDHSTNIETRDDGEQPATGDLKALRASKIAASTSQPGSDPNSTAVLNSMYGSLTAKTMSIAMEIGYGENDVEKTLLRIPSTRNMAVIGGRKSMAQRWIHNRGKGKAWPVDVEQLVDEIVSRECMREGGVGCAANIWIQRAVGLHKGPGMGKQSHQNEGH
ncbi:hypothetical protein BGW36DRAFT_286256 [Talaromyces proteolyticus]|uniref:tRNA (uracil-O(2)-)-methyltransferase n=1 Tax=Talaromyces proteolyticus TaxID=1131652 RepID=A0AAD4Q6R4_9EURO|nr:uncharacterized protein BGW36DRAFT_286256 [Talaromyces proteolyticus]KAH8705597.1 hypothetical protein BGW36DRAFT_286256 [Talaromyces proteolyticus]